jgi:class 3 adenylate cyclase
LSDVGEWLERQKLSQYAEMFDASDIDFDVLVDLTEDDLRELSVSFGHRQRLLKAIVQLRAERAASAAASTTGPSPIAAAQTAMPAGERRLITVLFCDLVGSTAMTAAADDPEDMFELIAEYHAACSEVIERFGGYVARLVGDGVLAYFGNPRALEGEAERAVRAALAQRDAVQAMGEKRRLKLAVRIGIDTGMVIIGDLVYHGNAEEDTAVGDTPNLAARLQGMAEPGQIVFSQNTRRLVGTLFELSDMGVHTLKGFAVAMHVYRVEAEAEGASRFSIRASLTTASLIGREAQCALLGYLWRTAVTGKGQVVLVSGEPGIGKSHLLHNLRDSVADAAPALLL